MTLLIILGWCGLLVFFYKGAELLLKKSGGL